MIPAHTGEEECLHCTAVRGGCIQNHYNIKACIEWRVFLKQGKLVL
jgi:hypothetical protein